jgi:hypothetical protein
VTWGRFYGTFPAKYYRLNLKGVVCKFIRFLLYCFFVSNS